MATTGGNSQQQILNQLLERKSGVTLEELTKAVGLSRTAVNQQLVSLEKDGFVSKSTPRKTAGRPQHVYVLTEAGANRFPKQYSWFSRMLIETLRQQVGAEQVSQYMYDLGVKLSAALIPRLVGKNRTERIDEIVRIMNETGFVARTFTAMSGDKLPRVECKNCVYHDLSRDYPEVCRFDIGFLSGLMGAQIEHQSCMQRGGESCRFRFIPPA
jgi:DeoR family transcriptional regulator, suf operon transcriptional repressor